MRHLVAHRKLGRTSSHRKALLRNLCTSMIESEFVITTLPKAKELRPFVEKVVTLGRRALAARLAGQNETALHLTRQAAAYFFAGNAGENSSQHYHGPKSEATRTAGVAALQKLGGELAERFADRPGGYTRIYKLGRRKGDAAEMAMIEFVDRKDANK